MDRHHITASAKDRRRQPASTAQSEASRLLPQSGESVLPAPLCLHMLSAQPLPPREGPLLVISNCVAALTPPPQRSPFQLLNAHDSSLITRASTSR